MSDFPLVLLLVVVPAVGAIITGAMRNAPVKQVKIVALAFTLLVFVIAVALWIGFDKADTNYQFVSSAQWIPTLGINFSVGVDGVSLVMIALIALLLPIVLGASWEEKLPAGRSIGSYFSLLLMLESTLIGVFAATDVFLFYVFFELMLLPMYFLIGAYGGPRRTYAATKFFLYSLFGGLMMLASVIALYVVSRDHIPGGTLDWTALQQIASEIPESTQMWIFAGFAIAFAIKAPLVPFHTWLPDAGAEAPVGSGTLIVGVLDKVGTFGFLRICLPLLPAASAKFAWLILLLAVIGIFYGGIVAAGQRDLKRFVTYTSIAHFGFIAMGVFVFSTQALSGAVIYMVAHGLATSLLFLVIGMLTSRGGSRLISDYGGVWKVAPILGGMFLIGSLATIALPGTSSFVAEFLVLIGSFATQPVWASFATAGIVIAAIYMLWIFQRTMTGPVRGAAVIGTVAGPDFGLDKPAGSKQLESGHTVTVKEHQAPTKPKALFGDLNIREIAVLTPLVALIMVLGVYPKPMLDVVNPTVAKIIEMSGHTDPVPAAGAVEGAGN